jgi:hypothetical protein
MSSIQRCRIKGWRVACPNGFMLRRAMNEAAARSDIKGVLSIQGGVARRYNP